MPGRDSRPSATNLSSTDRHDNPTVSSTEIGTGDSRNQQTGGASLPQDRSDLSGQRPQRLDDNLAVVGEGQDFHSARRNMSSVM